MPFRGQQGLDWNGGWPPTDGGWLVTDDFLRRSLRAVLKQKKKEKVSGEAMGARHWRMKEENEQDKHKHKKNE